MLKIYNNRYKYFNNTNNYITNNNILIMIYRAKNIKFTSLNNV
ncbi:hypothetical protein CoNPh16_CDS0004 [Staphylococcus phage S-CoN_Ph16]|nr:hypothetical protein CoNPh16_CDS0004 [Staphylococcus phage S-CoN_Ph16]